MLFLQHMKPMIVLFLPALSSLSCSNLSSSFAPAAPVVETAGASDSKPTTQRKIVKKASMTMKSRSLKSSADRSVSLVRTYKGHVHASSITENSYEATIKVPPTYLEPLIARLETVGKVTHKRISSDDVTSQHRDLTAELQNKIALRTRLRALLAKATNVKDILNIEKELARVQTEIDQLSQRLKSLNSKVALSTLSLTIKRQRIPGPLGIVSKGGGWVMGKLNNLN